MITPKIEDVKQEVDDEISEAFKEFCKSKIKDLKAQIYSAQRQSEEYGMRAKKLEAELNMLTADELRKSFFKHDVMRQESPYETVLKT